MALVQRDYILRLIESVAAALARIVRRRETGDLAGARRESQIATDELLGPLSSLARSVDSRTAADLISEPWRLTAWAGLLSEDAETLRQMGQEEPARRQELRAMELILEARLRGAEFDSQGHALLHHLRRRIPNDSLGTRYADALKAGAGERNDAA
jgi:hypothetical protein